MKAKLAAAIAAATLILAITACNGGSRQGGGVPRTVTELPGTRAERIHALSRRMTPSARERLIGTVTDANILVEQLGDGNLGPSDFQTYGRIRVLPTDVVRWGSGPSKLSAAPPWGDAPQPSAAPQPIDWWIKQPAHESLAFYEAQPVFTDDGWIGVSPQGIIYFRTMTR